MEWTKGGCYSLLRASGSNLRQCFRLVFNPTRLTSQRFPENIELGCDFIGVTEMDKLSIITLELGKAFLIPSNALIAALGIGVILLWSRGHRAGRWVITITAIVSLFVSTVPVASWIAKPLETRFPPIRIATTPSPRTFFG